MGIEEFPSAPPQQPGKRAKQPPPAGWQVGILIVAVYNNIACNFFKKIIIKYVPKLVFSYLP